MSEPIKLYLDEDAIRHALIQGLRWRSIDVLTVVAAGLQHASDEVQLEYATVQNRTVFTFNTRDFARLHAEYMRADKHHSGIIVSDQLTASVVVVLKRLLRLTSSRSAEDMRDWLEYLSNWRG